MITYGSVCSGIEAASVAWHPLGLRACWFAEIEPFPSAVLAARWPDVENLGDMTKIAKRVMVEAVAAPDVLVGGTPCQAFSVAGMREGLADPRGALTIKYVELLDAIDHVRAMRGEPEAACVWENVPGVLSDKGNAFGCFLGALVGESQELQPPGGKWKDAGCVYGPRRTVAWRVLDAQYFGLAQRRRRVFVVASARAGFDPAAVLFEREGLRRDHPPRRDSAEGVAGTIAASTGGADENDARDGRLIAFGGNNTAGPIDVATARNACNSASGRLDFESETFVVHGTQDPCMLAGLAHALGRNNGQENAVFDPNQITSATNRSQPTPGLSHTLPASSQAPVAFSIQAGALRTNPASGPDGVGVQADHAYTLEARAEVQAVQVASAVRRLTPRECERLQGFPDDYTLIPWRGKPAEECPDGPRYKAIGNSKAIPVVRWVGRRLMQQLRSH